MKSIAKYNLILLAVAALLSSCSTPNEPTPQQNVEIGIHPQGWLDLQSSNFHGTFLAAKQYDVAQCQQCHGNQFDGGLVGVSCRKCHETFPHPEGWVGIGEGSHKQYIQSHNYDFQSCKACHGANYDLVKVDNSCRTCHTSDAGPEACNTCHGVFAADGNDLRNAAPPAGLHNETEASSPAVGAHQAHLNYFESVEATCQECHTVPATMAAAGHIDGDGEAEVTFNGPLALTISEDSTRVPAPIFDHETHSCQNTYCHGNWALLKASSNQSFVYAEDKIQGNAAAPVWNDPATGACGTCHDLPPRGHNPFDLTACAGCHTGVIDAEGKIIDQTKHVNGKVNVFGQEIPMF